MTAPFFLKIHRLRESDSSSYEWVEFFSGSIFLSFLKCMNVNIELSSMPCCLSGSTGSLWKITPWHLQSMLTYSPVQLCMVLLSLDSLVFSVQERCLTFAGSAWLCQVSLTMSRRRDEQMFSNICSIPNFTMGSVTLLKTRGLNLFVDPSVMAAALEEAPISTRESESYQNAKIKGFGSILSNPDRFCNPKQQCIAWISDLDVSPLLEKNK